tara:strand:+ start:1785 stop:2075 length:291 start_codon:yes stop_codon:yes gene_type:complete
MIHRGFLTDVIEQHFQKHATASWYAVVVFILFAAERADAKSPFVCPETLELTRIVTTPRLAYSHIVTPGELGAAVRAEATVLVNPLRDREQVSTIR